MTIPAQQTQKTSIQIKLKTHCHNYEYFLNNEHFQDQIQLNKNMFQSVESSDAQSDTEPSSIVKQTDNQGLFAKINQGTRNM